MNTSSTPTPRAADARAPIGGHDLHAGDALALDGDDGDHPGAPVDELVHPELAHHHQQAAERDLVHLRGGARGPHLTADQREGGLVEDGQGRVIARPALDQKRVHLTMTTRVPRPGPESSENSSTSRRVPERPRPSNCSSMAPPSRRQVTAPSLRPSWR